MAAKKPKSKVPRFIPKTARQLRELVGDDAVVLVSALSIKTILEGRADKKIEAAILKE